VGASRRSIASGSITLASRPAPYCGLTESGVSSKPVATIRDAASTSRVRGCWRKSTAPTGQARSHLPHQRQYSGSSTACWGAAVENGTPMARQAPRSRSNALGTVIGQASSQSRQPVHFDSST
jgi:hypothetical protein